MKRLQEIAMLLPILEEKAAAANEVFKTTESELEADLSEKLTDLLGMRVIAMFNFSSNIEVGIPYPYENSEGETSERTHDFSIRSYERYNGGDVKTREPLELGWFSTSAKANHDNPTLLDYLTALGMVAKGLKEGENGEMTKLLMTSLTAYEAAKATLEEVAKEVDDMKEEKKKIKVDNMEAVILEAGFVEADLPVDLYIRPNAQWGKEVGRIEIVGVTANKKSMTLKYFNGYGSEIDTYRQPVAKAMGHLRQFANRVAEREAKKAEKEATKNA